MNMSELESGGAGFQRRPNGRRGCGCCGLWFAGLLALPMVVLVALVAVI
jgi:hypothetical protein